MSVLPKAVQAQLDQAEAIQRQLSGEVAPEAGNPAEPEAVVAPVEQVVEPVVQDTQVAQPAPSVDWEHKFRVMEGKYRAELPRLLDQNRELSDRLEQAIKTMETKAQEPQKDTKLVTDADVESFGEDMVDMVRRAAREEFDKLSKQFTDLMDKRVGQVADRVAATEQRVEKTDADKFWDVVNAPDAAPDFDKVNEDPRWFAFLDSRVTGTRYTRRVLAEDAIRNMDATALIEQVKAFRETIAPAAAAPVTPTPKSKPSLNAQVAPSSSRSNAVVEEQGRVWSGAEYAAALDHRNLQRMSREDYEANVAEAEQALLEGRVRF